MAFPTGEYEKLAVLNSSAQSAHALGDGGKMINKKNKASTCHLRPSLEAAIAELSNLKDRLIA